MVDEHRVRERAYYIWEDEGRGFGRAEAHWFQAEAELHASATPLTVQPVVAGASLAPSPAKALKPAAGRAKAIAVKAPDAKAAKPKANAAKAAPKAAKPVAPKAGKAPRASVVGIALH